MTKNLTRCRRSRRAFKAGDKVTVFRMEVFRRPFIEGHATIIKPLAADPEFYLVRFDGEQRQLERLVHAGDWQSEPYRLLENLLAEWRLSMTPEILAEFFPADLAHLNSYKGRTGT